MRLQMILSFSRATQLCMLNYSFFIMHFTVGIYYYFSIHLRVARKSVNENKKRRLGILNFLKGWNIITVDCKIVTQALLVAISMTGI